MKDNGFIPKINDEEVFTYIQDFFDKAVQDVSERCFIGSNDDYENIFGYCKDYGVDKIYEGNISLFCMKV